MSLSSSTSSRAGLRSVALATAAAVVVLTGTATVSAQSYGFAAFSAVVAKSGTTTRSSGVQSSTRLKKGSYLVVFSRPVNSCAYTASPVGKKGGQASVQPVGGQPAQIRVYTFNKAGKPANSGFVVQVSCSS